MQRRLVLSSLITTLSAGTVGCTLTRSAASTDYKPIRFAIIPELSNPSSLKVSRLQVRDARVDIFTGRPLTDPYLIVNKHTAHFQPMEGYWAADRPVAECLTESARTAFSDVGLIGSGDSAVTLRIQLNRVFETIDGARLMEFIIGADVSFSLHDEVAGEPIWSQRFSATAKTKVAGVFLTADDCLRLLPQTFGEVFGQVFGSASFRAALKRGHAEA